MEAIELLENQQLTSTHAKRLCLFLSALNVLVEPSNNIRLPGCRNDPIAGFVRPDCGRRNVHVWTTICHDDDDGGGLSKKSDGERSWLRFKWLRMHWTLWR